MNLLYIFVFKSNELVLADIFIKLLMPIQTQISNYNERIKNNGSFIKYAVKGVTFLFYYVKQFYTNTVIFVYK